VTISLDHSGSWTVDDIESFPEDNRRRELVDGSLILRPSPSAGHQIIAARLAVALDESAPAACHASLGIQVRFSESTALVPDVVVVHGWASETTYFRSTDVVLAVEISDESSRAWTGSSSPRSMRPAASRTSGESRWRAGSSCIPTTSMRSETSTSRIRPSIMMCCRSIDHGR
jgi:putative restriction endonuclease